MDWRAGFSSHQLTAKYSINRLIIARLITKFLRTGRTSLTHFGLRPRETSQHEGSLIERTIINDPTSSSGHIRNSLQLKIIERTIRRRPVETGLFSRRPPKKNLSCRQKIKKPDLNSPRPVSTVVSINGELCCFLTNLMVFSFVKRKCYPLTRCIKKLLTSPVIM